MALFDTTWYVSSVGWTAVTAWTTGTAKAAGDLIRATAPAVGAERVFICIVAGTTHATTQPTWVNTRGAKNTDNTITWQECTGASAVNGDVTNTPESSTVRSQVITLGAIIKNNAATHYFICSTSGTAGVGEPTYNTTAGVTTADNTATWTCIGAVGNFTGGQAPFARLESALTSTWGAAGNSFFIKSDHAETQTTNITLTGASTSANPNFWYCHNGAAYPPLAANLTTGASISSTSTAALTIQGIAIYSYGIVFSAGSGQMRIGSAGIPGLQHFYNCSFQFTAGATSSILLGGNSASATEKILWDNCTVKFSNVSQTIAPSFSRLLWRNTGQVLASGSSVPTSLFNYISSRAGDIVIEGCDLSQIGSGSSIVHSNAGGPLHMGSVIIKDCKLDSAVTPSSVIVSSSLYVHVIRCSHTTNNHLFTRNDMYGVESTETTIVRTNGTTDGVTPQSRKIVTTASAKWFAPFEMSPLIIWNDTVGSAITVTVEGIWGGGAVPNNDDIWMDVEYLGDASTPLGSWSIGTKANNLAANSALASSSESWGGSTTEFKMTATFTPQMKGPISIYVKAGLASSTFYIDPKPHLSIGPTVLKAAVLAPGVLSTERRSASPSLNMGF